jgi:ketosteroid isomerase-like protein
VTLVRSLLAVVWCTIAAAPVVGQDGSTVSALADLDRRLQDAVVTHDVPLLEQHLAEDFTFLHSGGNSETKADWLGFAKRVPPRYLARKVSEQVVDVHGDVAMVLGRLDVRNPAPPGQPTSAEQCVAVRYVHLYARRGGRWMFLSHQTTEVLVPAHACADRQP